MADTGWAISDLGPVSKGPPIKSVPATKTGWDLKDLGPVGAKPKTDYGGAASTYGKEVLSTLSDGGKILWDAFTKSKSVVQAGGKLEDVAIGGLKAVGGGMLSLAELSAQGLSGFVSAVQGRGFYKGMNSEIAFQQGLHETMGALTNINLAPENEQQAALNNLLMLLPKGIQAAGDTAFKKTGSAFWGAATQAALTFLTLQPSIAGKMLAPLRRGSKSPAAPIASDAFSELAAKNPEGAEALAAHVEGEDPALAKDMRKKAEDAQERTPAENREFGRDTSDFDMPERPNQPRDTDETPAPGEDPAHAKARAKKARGETTITGKDLLRAAAVGDRDVLPAGKQPIVVPAGKPHIRLKTPAEVKAGLREAAHDINAPLATQTPDPRIAVGDGLDRFYSALSRGVAGLKVNKAPPQDWVNLISKLPGVKGDEIKATGVMQFIKTAQGPLTKEQVLKFVNDNRVQIGRMITQEAPKVPVTAASPKLQEYVRTHWGAGYNLDSRVYSRVSWADTYLTLGGDIDKHLIEEWPDYTKYKELQSYLYGRPTPEVDARIEAEGKSRKAFEKELSDLFTKYYELKKEIGKRTGLEDLQQEAYKYFDQEQKAEVGITKTRWQGRQAIKGGTNYKEMLITLKSPDMGEPVGASQAHFDTGAEPLIVHVRMSDFKDEAGGKVLGIHEIQSDWGKARKNFLARYEAMGPEERAEFDQGDVDVPRGGPFVDSTEAYTRLAVKNIMTYAADNGYRRVEFPTGIETHNSTGGKVVGQVGFYEHMLPPIVEKTIKPYDGTLDRATGRLGFVVTPEMKSAPVPLFQQGFSKGFMGYTNEMSQGWREVHRDMQLAGKAELQTKLLDSLAEDKPLSLHEVLDDVLKAKPASEAGKTVHDMIAHLRSKVGDVKVFVAGDYNFGTRSGEWWENCGGLYSPAERAIYLPIPHGFMPETLRNLIHESVHAATVDFMRANPRHPEVKELENLLFTARMNINALVAEAKNLDPKLTTRFDDRTFELRTDRTLPGYMSEKTATGDVYGLQDIFEMTAEIKTHTGFQELILKSGKVGKMWDRLGKVVSEMAMKIARMLGIKEPKEAQLFHDIMASTNRVIDLQADAIKAGHLQLGIGKPSPAQLPREAFKKDRMFNHPSVQSGLGKMEGYVEEALHTINPEALGPEAKVAAAVIAKQIAKQVRSDSAHLHESAGRREYWEKNKGAVWKFISKAEKGEALGDPVLEEARRAYKNWNAEIALQDKTNGFDYDEQDHYIAHIFEDGDRAVNYLKGKYGKKWGDPGFIKDRTFDLYEDAMKQGFKPKFDNPEDIMLARQHASDIAQMKVDSLKEMTTYGVAEKMEKVANAKTLDIQDKKPPDYPSTPWRSPNGDWYWVHDNAYAVMKNAFDVKGLWERQGFFGDAFRGMMAVKNRIVPIKLAFSLFHPIHVATIDNATAMVRASKEMLTGHIGPAKWAWEMANAARYKGFGKTSYNALFNGGSRMLKVWQGRIKEGDLTAEDRQALTYMFEGGMIPELSAQFRTNSRKLLREAINKRSVTAAFHAPFAMIEAIQAPMFERWIPDLKIASYLKDVETALKVDPRLADNAMSRQLAFRKIAKSVDNRYGEMSYNTLFWNRMVKDLAVANTLSLGWQLGFIREYGGGALDLGHAARTPGGIVSKAKSGLLDRPMFVMAYSTQALLYGGLLTYALTGTTPQSLVDYIYPRTGGKTPDGKDARSTTMFYPKEFYAIAKHIENEGVIKGIGDSVRSKASGLIGLATEALTGMNDFNEQIRNPDDPAYKKIEQTVAYVLSDMKPISAESIRKGSGSPKEVGLAVSGFSPAPKYISDTATEGKIKSTYQEFYAPKATPYERAQFGADVREAKKAYLTGNPSYDKMMDSILDKYDPQGLDPGLERKLVRGWEKDEESGKATNPTFKMFQRMDWPVQKKLLDNMSPDEREEYLPYSNKKYLRDNYEPPK